MLGRDKALRRGRGADARSMRRQLARALKDTRTVELRLDWLAGDAEITDFLEAAGAPRTGAVPDRHVPAPVKPGADTRDDRQAAAAFWRRRSAPAAAWYDFEIETLTTMSAEN